MKIRVDARIDPALLTELDAAIAERPDKMTRTGAIEAGLKMLLRAWKRTKGGSHGK